MVYAGLYQRFGEINNFVICSSSIAFIRIYSVASSIKKIDKYSMHLKVFCTTKDKLNFDFRLEKH